MKMKMILIDLIAFSCFFLFLIPSAHSAWYQCDIQYQEAITKILKRGDITWGSPPLPDNNYNFGSVLVSANGSKVLFVVGCEYCDTPENRPFLVNPDGLSIQDLYNMLPPDMLNRTWAWRNLIINDNASKIFFRASMPTDWKTSLFVYDVLSSTRQKAVNDEFDVGSDWHFRINETGSRVYLDKYNAGWSEALQYYMQGLYYADPPSVPSSGILTHMICPVIHGVTTIML